MMKLEKVKAVATKVVAYLKKFIAFISLVQKESMKLKEYVNALLLRLKQALGKKE